MDTRYKARQASKFGMIATTAAVAVSVGAMAIEFAPHTFFIEKYKSIVQLHKLGDKVPIDQEVKKLFDEVLDDLKIDEKKRNSLEPIPIFGFNLHHAGISETRFKAFIGIPINFTYKDKSSIDTLDLRIGRDRETINLYHPAAEDLMESLVLSDKAKKYGIAREVLMLYNNLPLYKTVESTILVPISVLAAEFARINYHLASKRLIAIAFGTSAILGYSVWFQIRDNLTTYFERDVDKELSLLGPDYIEGGKEFYEKLLKRNVALRALMGAEGAKQFNRDGDEIFFIRHKRTPITYRKKFFSEITLQQNEELA